MKRLRAYLVDDEQLALNRLRRMLEETSDVEVVGETTEPLKALRLIPRIQLDMLFLDIQMPELTGFELLQKLGRYPPVIFTTAYDEFALRAFEVFSVDYLVKPIESERLEMALQKLYQFKVDRRDDPIARVEQLLENLTIRSTTRSQPARSRIATRVGGRIKLIEIADITHFLAEDKMTFAQTADSKRFPVDRSLSQLESDLDPVRFLRIHRHAIINLAYIDEIHGWFSGRVMIRLTDKIQTELVVARERVRILKRRFGI